MFKIKEIKEKKVWEDFFAEVKEKTFLQSWAWGEFNESMADRIFRFGVYDDEKLISTAQIIIISAKRGTFLFLPHGPNIAESVFKDGKIRILEFLLERLKELAKKENLDFIRVAPIWERNEENIQLFKKLNFKEAPIHIHPELTWELDIFPSEEEIMAQMRKTTRYLIKKAEKDKEIEIIKNSNVEAVKEFNNLYQTTKERKGFVPFSLEYLKNEFFSFSKEGQILIVCGRYKGEPVASGIFILWNGIGFYHHGASSLNYPKIPVSYLVLWEAIKTSKEMGCKKFNFWGIAPCFDDLKSEKFKKHPWAGLTLFKMGFGGYSKEYVKTQDFALSGKYWFSFAVEKIRKLKRGL